MKKFFFILTVFILSLTGGIVFAACDGGTSPETPPSNQTRAPKLEKSSFSITYSVGGNGAEYDLIWRADNAVKYKVECDETEVEITKPSYSLTGFSADTVHSVTVTAIGENDLQSQPVELKFKGTKLETPTNVRLHYTDRYGTAFSWNEHAAYSSSYYLISFEELDLEIETSKPFGTGKFKYVPCSYEEFITLDGLRSIFKNCELYPLESLRVQTLPYLDKVFNFTANTDVLELNLPSDFSEQSVNLYAGDLSNPTNIRWNETLDAYGNATVKWDGAISDYKYQIKVQHPEGYSNGIITPEKGISEGKVYFGNGLSTGDYTVTVEPVYDEFRYIGKDDDAKSVTYMFYLPQPITETLSFHVTQKVLETPKNLHIENGYIVCDKVENAEEYVFSIKISKDSAINLGTYTNRISLDKYLGTAAWINEDGLADLIVYVRNDGTDLTGFDDNGNPNIIVYEHSESAVISDAIQLKRIPAVQNVRIDYDTKTVYWDGVEEAETYEIVFYNAGSGKGGTVTDTQFQWKDNMDISDYTEVVITAKCKFEVTTENGIAVMCIPSKCSTPLK